MPNINSPDPFSLGIAAVDTIANPLFAHLTNVKNRKFARESYKTQRQDALSDWKMQNEYNSPRAQMQRYQEAGLNPHLIYGQSNQGGEVRSGSMNSANGSAPQSEASRNFLAAYQQRQVGAQTDLTQLAQDNMKADKNLKDAQTIATLKNANLTDVQITKILQDMDFAKGMYPIDVALKNQSLSKGSQEITLAWRKDFREALTMTGNLKEQAERIATLGIGRKKTQADIDRIAQEIDLMKKDGTLKDFDIKWRAAGHNPGDPQVVKIWDEIMNRLGFGGDHKSLSDETGEAIDHIFNGKKNTPLPKANPRKLGGYDSQGNNQ